MFCIFVKTKKKMDKGKENKRAVRKKQIKDGYFDGRFSPKVYKSGKEYQRDTNNTLDYLNQYLEEE